MLTYHCHWVELTNLAEGSYRELAMEPQRERGRRRERERDSGWLFALQLEVWCPSSMKVGNIASLRQGK